MLSGERVRAVVDSGPVIHLSWIDRLDLLAELFAEVLAPPIVRDESLAAPPETRGMEQIHALFQRGDLRVEALSGPPDAALRDAAVDRGEAAAIQLAEEVGAHLFITDDAAARSLAERRGLNVTGTLGVLYLARERGLIPAVLPLALELHRRGQWLSDRLIAAIEREEHDA